MTDTQKKGGKDTGKVTLKATCVCVTLLRFILPACMNQGLTQYTLILQSSTRSGLYVSKYGPVPSISRIFE